MMLRKAASERDLYRMCTKTFTWRLLTGPELTEVYLNEMRRDFPAGELKPLSMILTSEAEGTAHTWGVFDGDTLAAYLLMVRPEGCMVAGKRIFETSESGSSLSSPSSSSGATAEAPLLRRMPSTSLRDTGAEKLKRMGVIGRQALCAFSRWQLKLAVKGSCTWYS